ncbi:hypothetical protein ACHQM5_003873 [Ranunculus cassubicifolius]
MGTRRNLWFLPSVLLLLACIQIHLSIASNNLSPGQSLSGMQTLISERGFFEFGFFAPQNSSRNYYIGIWYKKGSVQRGRVVWVANREKPVTDPFSSDFRLLEDGNFDVVNKFRSPVWQSNLTSSTLNSTLLVLGDNGNLVLRDRSDPSDVIWQSFDYPTDTWLPGQKLGVNMVTGLRNVLTSWKSADDPSPGNFTVQLDPNGRAQYVTMWNGIRRYWVSGEWNGRIFTLIQDIKVDIVYNISYISNEKERYFTFKPHRKSTFVILVIDPSGKFKLAEWLENDQSSVKILFQPKQQCYVYNYCGAFGTCSRNDSGCGCLPGFKLSRDWSGNSYACARRIPLKCMNSTFSRDTDKFLRIPQTLLPINPNQSSVGSSEACKTTCLNKCACTAYAYEIGQCSIWDGDLLNVQPLSHGDIGGGDLYLKVAASETETVEGPGNRSSSTQRSKSKLWLIIALPISLTVLLSSFIIFCQRRRKLKKNECVDRREDLLLFDTGAGLEDMHSTDDDTLKQDSRIRKDFDLPLFSFSSVSAATNSFSDANKLGEGGFGPVYKGCLRNGQEVAVKRLSRSSGQGLKELRNEAELIGKLQHRNLVRLLGCCIELEEKILVYEYMPNKSLDSLIFDSTIHHELDLGRRFHIIEGIAQGLLYLHEYSRLRIIHRDLKASNILLDGDMNPKISDFGMARIFRGKDSRENTKRIVGTYGYMPPEYAIMGISSVKSDVFSFGVLVLEIISGKRNRSFHLSGSHNLLNYAWDLWKDGREMELMDPMLLGEQSSTSSHSRYIHVALLCVQEKPLDRPNMSDVVNMLNNQSLALLPPKQPAFVVVENSLPVLIYSVNDVTASLVEAR